MKKQNTAEEYLEKIMNETIKDDCPVQRHLSCLSVNGEHILFINYASTCQCVLER